jgi:hypothetical protein
MKLHIVHNAAGKILAAADLTANANGPRPVAGKGHREIVLDVPREHRSRSFLEICQNLRVNAKARTLVVAGRAATRRSAKKKK